MMILLAPLMLLVIILILFTPLTHSSELPIENGVKAQSILLSQLNSAKSLIKAYNPDRLIVFGGDCHVSQAPFAYLNERYEGNLGVLWLDAHSDVSTPDMFSHEHAMVLAISWERVTPYFLQLLNA